MKVTKAQPFHSRYANHFQVTVTPTEVRILFGELETQSMAPGGTGTVAVGQMPDAELHTAITLPLPLVRELREHLTQLMTQLEEQLRKTAVR